MEQGEQLKTCPRCKAKTHHKHCPTCTVDGNPLALTGDQLADEASARVAAGEDVDLDAMFGNKDGFEPVPRG